jgi:hypothetical protein
MVIVFMCFGLNILTAQDISTGLVLHYEFEGTSGDVIDAAGSHNGTNYGATRGVSGKIGNAFNFDGSSHVTINNHSDISGFSEFTLAAWVYPTTLSTNKTVLAKVNSGRDFVLKFYNTTLEAHFYNGGYRRCYGNSTVPVNQWVHVLCTWKNNQWKIYYNGVLENTCSLTGYDPPWISNEMYVGALTGTSEKFIGSIDEVRIYNRALTDADVTELYNYSGGSSTVSSVNSYTGAVQLNLSLAGDDLSISGGNTVSLPYGTSDITEISAGTGLSGGGSAGNVTLDANSGSALWNANKLQDSPIAITVPSSGQVLKWNGSAWAPATDETDSGGNDFWLQNGSDIYFNTGNVGIGTTSPDEKLTVNGKIHAKEVIVDLSIPAPDYVFDDGYKLRPMSELENFVIKNSHLPDIPPAKEMEENGIDLSLINMMLLKRIEELTLYIIDQEKRIKSIESLATPQK